MPTTRSMKAALLESRIQELEKLLADKESRERHLESALGKAMEQTRSLKDALSASNARGEYLAEELATEKERSEQLEAKVCRCGGQPGEGVDDAGTESEVENGESGPSKRSTRKRSFGALGESKASFGADSDKKEAQNGDQKGNSGGQGAGEEDDAQDRSSAAVKRQRCSWYDEDVSPETLERVRRFRQRYLKKCRKAGLCKKLF